MTRTGLDDLRSRLHKAYVSQHSGCGVRLSPDVLASAALVMGGRMVSARCWLAPAAGTHVPRRDIVTQNLTFTARKTAVAVGPEEG